MQRLHEFAVMPSFRGFPRIWLKLLPALSAVIASTIATARAAPVSDGKFGVGILLGEPSGLSLRYGLDSRHTLDAALAFSVGEFFEILAAQAWTFPGALPGRNSFARNLAPYAGVGGALLFSVYGRRGILDLANGTGIAAGLRIPLGVEWTPEGTPLGVFAEVAPGIGLLPGTFTFFNGGVGLRYYF